jgi:hypothetical protein
MVKASAKPLYMYCGDMAMDEPGLRAEAEAEAVAEARPLPGGLPAAAELRSLEPDLNKPNPRRALLVLAVGVGGCEPRWPL